MVRIISRELVILGHQVRVIGVYPWNYPAPDYEDDLGVQVWRLREKRGKFGWILPYISQYKMIKRWSQKREIEIIEAPDSRGWIAFWPKLSIPVIIRANGSNTYFSRILGTHLNFLTSILEKRSIQRADYLIAVSHYTAKITKQVFNLSGDLAVIHNSIEIPVIENELIRDPNTIIFSGSLNKKKGIFELIEGVLLLLKENPEIVLKIFGKDTMDETGVSVKEKLMNLIPEEFKNNIVFEGHVNRKILIEEFERCTLAIFPSYAEAFAHAPLESMVCGCPTIYTKLGSGSELIQDGIDGLLINPSEPEEIAVAIDRILKNTDFAETIGNSGRKRVKENFSKELMTIKSLEFYQTCIADFQCRKTVGN
ncbi:MAG: glycosyltransferase family 4 protein [Bacteroidetes bacterium]|nr:glycosyltransferase family 4 protein [Bacteroidota bacterium]